MSTLHWAENQYDRTLTLCNLPVGYVLVELSDDVTSEDTDEFLDDRDACENCKDVAVLGDA
ncbi:hypothetical protein LCGC14_0288660 [marine sediment metagenome]|uniref:Uncharacterized protein n=1 Tax=marine sediment metagenome TaxID=412755 RepID=A0A0F9TYM7_9ZZZZ